MLTLPSNGLAVLPLNESDHFVHGTLKLEKPTSAKWRVNQGIVKYTGASVEAIRPGDHVFFSGYSGSLFEISGEGRLILLPESHVVARLDNLPTTEIPGLYCRDPEDGTYFNATYEIALLFVRDAIEASSWFKNMKVEDKGEIPSGEFYDDSELKWGDSR